MKLNTAGAKGFAKMNRKRQLKAKMKKTPKDSPEYLAMAAELKQMEDDKWRKAP
jgi:hypothetical protein